MDLENIDIKVDKPYPEVVDAVDDFATVSVLKNLAFARSGELSGVATYIYQSVIADKTNQDIANVFEDVAVVEMTHLDMLMHNILEFGGNPKYEDAKGVPFTTNFITYNVKLIDMLNADINAEKMAIEEYSKAINIVKNQSLKDLFVRIIEDEQKHLEVFKYLRDNVQFMSI